LSAIVSTLRRGLGTPGPHIHRPPQGPGHIDRLSLSTAEGCRSPPPFDLHRAEEREAPKMGSDAPDLGKGLFGYRRSAVQQIISDRDVMLRQADGRVRAAESRVAELEDELSGIRERSRRMEEQLERLRSMVERTAAGQPPVMEAMPQDAPPSDATVAFEEEAPAQDAL